MNASSPQSTLEFAPDRSTAGFRLHQFSVLNWGTFHGRVHSFYSDGRTSLLSGGNGAGKSTLADAVLTLLIDSRKRNYNQASAGGGERKQKKERNEKDYILGSYSEEHDEERGYGRAKQLRKPGQAVTVLLAHFYNETYQQHVTLAQVLWLSPSGGSPKRAFVVAKRKLTIEGDFNDLGSPAEVNQKLKDRALEPIDTFTQYSQRFHEALCLSAEKNPMDIFNQAVCIKDISNLTNFIREYMLDDGGAPKKLEDLRSNFEELRRTYERIEREKKRLNHLNRIQGLHHTVLAQEEQVETWSACLEAAPLFFAETELELRQEQAESIDLNIVKAKAEETSENLKAEAERTRAQDLKKAIESSEEGQRLQQIKEELSQLGKEIQPKQERHKKFTTRAGQWQTGSVCQTEVDFVQILRDAEKDVARLSKKSKELGRQILKQGTALDQLTDAQAEISTEVRSLQEREGNISDELTRRRNRFAEALGLTPKELPFVGELVQVREADAQWTGAIERLVRSFALCMLVPDRLRKQADAHAHKTNLRGLLVYHVVESGSRSKNPQLTENSVAEKLEIHENAGEFETWIASELSFRFDHQCFQAPDDAFNQAKTAITIAGLIKQRGSERRKDDRYDIHDRSKDVLGWDNSAKIAALQERHQQQEAERTQLLADIKRQEREQSAIDDTIKAAQSLPDIADAWEVVDYFTPTLKQEALRIEKKQLEDGSDELKSLEAEMEKAKTAEQVARDKSKQASKRLGGLDTEKAQNDSGIEGCQTILSLAQEDPEQLQKLRDRIPTIKELLEIPPTNLTALQQANRDMTDEFERRRRKALTARDQAGNDAKAEMRQFLDPLSSEEPKLHDELYSEGIRVPGYSNDLFEPFVALRNRIEEEDLPQHQKRFNRMLQTNLIEDVSSFDGLLTEHEDRIKQRIEDLNLHLKAVDFDRSKHTYIQLVPQRMDDDNQKWFRGHRKYALQDIAHEENTDTERSERFKRVRHLLDELGHDERRTQNVIDVRNWFNFRADEYYRADDCYKESYSGASKKSGGEKNRLASTILATSIAYQYGISLNDERQTETFRLVVVDEMFSKTDDEFSTYLLELFKTFNLQLIIVHPLDAKVHLAQKYVERYHIVTRPTECSEIHNLTVQEYQQVMAEVSES